MAITRRELEILVDRQIRDLDNDALARLAEGVLGKPVIRRGHKYAIGAPDRSNMGQGITRVPDDVGDAPFGSATKNLVENERLGQKPKRKEDTMVKLTKPQIDVLIDTLEGKDRFAEHYAPAVKVVALGLAHWAQKSSGLSNDRLILTADGKARAEFERAKRKEA